MEIFSKLFKKKRSRLSALIASLMVLLISSPVSAAAAPSDEQPVLQVRFDEDTKILTLFYGKPDGSSYTLAPQEDNESNLFKGLHAHFNMYNVQHIVIDQTLKAFETTSTAYWFAELDMVQSIEGLGNINTKKVTSMKGMFKSSQKLTKLDFRGFQTANVTDMSNMFFNCTNLTSLDLSSFDTKNVQEMTEMFLNCKSLKTIVVSTAWSTDNVVSSNWMFEGCTSLRGDIGTTFDSFYINKTYARIDKTGKSGYLTQRVPYGLYDEASNTLTLYYGTPVSGSFKLNTENHNGNLLYQTDNEMSRVEKVVINPTFKNYKPEATDTWFCKFQYLQSIEGLDNINTL